MNDSKNTDNTRIAEEFLLANRVEVTDDGFSDRVMQRLPQRVDWEYRLNRIWQCICIVAAMVVCYVTDALDIIMTDIRVFFDTVSLETAATQWLYALSVPMLFISATLIATIRKAIYA